MTNFKLMIIRGMMARTVTVLAAPRQVPVPGSTGLRARDSDGRAGPVPLATEADPGGAVLLVGRCHGDV